MEQLRTSSLSLFTVIGILILPFTALAQTDDITVEITNSCSIFGDGTIVLTIANNDYPPPYIITLTDEEGNPLQSVITNNATTALNGLSIGTYCITVESGICTAHSCNLVVEPELTIESIAPICICEHGSAEIEVSGGSGNYTYAWAFTQFPTWVYSNEKVPLIPPPPFGSGPDNHTVIVTDNETGCQATASFDVGYCNGIDLASFIELTPDCNEEGTSTISVELPPATAVGTFPGCLKIYTQVGVKRVLEGIGFKT